MNKEEICVLVDSDKKAKKVRDILIEAGEEIIKEDKQIIFDKPHYFLKNDGFEKGWFIARSEFGTEEISIKKLRKMLLPKHSISIEVNAKDAPHVERLITALSKARIKHPQKWAELTEREKLSLSLEEAIEISKAINDGNFGETKAECIDRIVCYLRAVTGD